jgi:hypothetical protein
MEIVRLVQDDIDDLSRESDDFRLHGLAHILEDAIEHLEREVIAPASALVDESRTEPETAQA